MDLDVVTGRIFNTFAEIEAVRLELRKVGHPLVYILKKTVAAHNNSVCCYYTFVRFVKLNSFLTLQKGRKIDPKWEVESATIGCSHSVKHRDRSTKEEGRGKRNVKTYACHCTYQWRVKFHHDLQKYMVLSCNLNHANHPWSEEIVKSYQEVK